MTQIDQPLEIAKPAPFDSVAAVQQLSDVGIVTQNDLDALLSAKQELPNVQAQLADAQAQYATVQAQLDEMQAEKRPAVLAVRAVIKQVEDFRTNALNGSLNSLLAQALSGADVTPPSFADLVKTFGGG